MLLTHCVLLIEMVLLLPAGHMCVGVSSAVQDGLLDQEQTAASNVSQTPFFMICPVAPVNRAHANIEDIHSTPSCPAQTCLNIEFYHQVEKHLNFLNVYQ